ncbi:MAG: hypothetical protein R2705_11630 [Ilumatobacteraceae bacterium]
MRRGGRRELRTRPARLPRRQPVRVPRRRTGGSPVRHRTGTPRHGDALRRHPYAEPHRYQPTPELRAFYAQRAMLLRSCDRLLGIASRGRVGIELLGLDPFRTRFAGIGVEPAFRPRPAP